MALADRIGGVFQNRAGRAMTLRSYAANRADPPTECTVYGITRAYTPEQLVGDVKQTDTEVVIEAKSVAAGGWPAPPKNGDAMVIDGKVYTVQGDPTPRQLGSEILVYILRVRG